MPIEVKKNIVLVDDNILVREGLKILFEKLGPYKVSSEFDNGLDLINAFPLNPIPDLIVMDVSMPEMSGDKAMEVLHEKNIQIPVLILTINDDDAIVVKLFRLGVRGYVKKNSTAAIMKEALNDIFQKEYYHNEFLTYSLKNNEVTNKKTKQELLLNQFSERERVFMKLVCDEEEYTYGQIADKMFVQPRTVDGYRESIFEKFGIKSKTGLVLFVLKHQLLEHL